MTEYLNRCLKEERLKNHRTSIEEISKLFKIINRDLADANIPALSADRRFITAYNALLQLTTVVLRVHGLRTNPNKAGHHRVSIDALPEILGSEFQDLTDYFHACRIKRHSCDYTNSGETSDKEATEIFIEATSFKNAVLQWIKKTHPQLLVHEQITTSR